MKQFGRENIIIILILLIRYITIYLPIIFLNEWIYEENIVKFNNYEVIYFVSRAIFIGIAIYGLSFFTKIKQLKQFIYYVSICELFETIKLLFLMLAIENTIIHNSKLWEWQLGIFINIFVASYCIYKWKKQTLTL